MCLLCCTRRSALDRLRRGGAAIATRAKAAPAEHREFIAAAFRMKDDAVRAGDQPFGAVVVKDGRILGFGPSRVVLKKDATAHAEREAIREAQARLGRSDLSGAILYSSSRPCSACEAAAAEANVARMIHGSEATDAGRPNVPDRAVLMIDHVSIAVRDLAAAARFYEAVLATLGYAKLVDASGDHRLRQEISGVLAERAPRHDAGRSGQRRRTSACARASVRCGACVPCGGVAGRRQHRTARRARARSTCRGLLRGVHSRSRGQQDRGGDVLERGQASELRPPSHPRRPAAASVIFFRLRGRRRRPPVSSFGRMSSTRSATR